MCDLNMTVKEQMRPAPRKCRDRGKCMVLCCWEGKFRSCGHQPAECRPWEQQCLSSMDNAHFCPYALTLASHGHLLLEGLSFSSSWVTLNGKSFDAAASKAEEQVKVKETNKENKGWEGMGDLCSS